MNSANICDATQEPQDGRRLTSSDREVMAGSQSQAFVGRPCEAQLHKVGDSLGIRVAKSVDGIKCHFTIVSPHRDLKSTDQMSVPKPADCLNAHQPLEIYDTQDMLLDRRDVR